MKKICLAITLLTITTISKATIVYTDIPDETLASGGSININIDGAGADEFTFTDQPFGANPSPGIIFNDDAGFVMVGGPFPTAEWDVIAGININTTISSSSNFQNIGLDGYIDPFWAVTSFPSGDDTYIGVTFKLGADTHYGWLRVNWTSATGAFILKDFAYEDTPNTAIDAGEIEIPDVLVSSISVQGEGGDSTITTQGGTLQMIGTVLPADATDNSISWSVVNGTGSATIDSSGLLTAAEYGTVTVVATANDASGLSDSTVITIVNLTLSVTESFENNILVYPNPATDYIAIESKIQKMLIYSLDGEVVLSSYSIEPNKKIDVSSLSTGLYILQLIDLDGKNYTLKWQKQ